MKQDLNGVRTPEDVMRRLADNVKITSDEVEGLTVEVSKKVGDDEIISKINQSPESITLDANKININGVVSANGNFQIDREGNMICNNAQINGGSLDVLSSLDNPQVRVRQIEDVAGISLETILHGAGLFVWDSTNNDAFITLNTIGSFGGDDTLNGYIALRGGSQNYTPTIELFGETGGIVCDNIEVKDIYYDNLHPSSLEEKKKDFEKFESGLDIVKDTDIYKYHFKNESETDKKHIGFVIGENYNYRKELTDLDNKGVDLYSMVSVLWRAVQEQQVEIEKLKKEVKNDKN
mgnify:CR=1 FL=1